MLGVVLMNMGGPDSIEAVEPFLRNLFADRDLIKLPWGGLGQGALARFIAGRRAPKVRELYRSIGGRSPIGELTERQTRGLEAALRDGGLDCRCYVAMRYWKPFADDAARALRSDGVVRVLALTLYPQFSDSTTGSSLKDLRRALAAAGVRAPLDAIDRYGDDDAYLDALAEAVTAGLAEIPAAERERVPVLFSAHGLPQRYVDRGDPYEREVRATVAGVVARLGLGDRWRLGFQSKVGPVKWLGPSTEVVIHDLARQGARALLVVPVAFVSDHIETLQEIDLRYRDVAHAAGITEFRRAPALNDRPAFIAALAGLVRRHLDARAPGAASPRAAGPPGSRA
ncbi:MAG: ferrochelatase [Deltaproteobacteria bacterium]|nr:ferrochelatase [Deltaproteobacteria bacterium]